MTAISAAQVCSNQYVNSLPNGECCAPFQIVDLRNSYKPLCCAAPVCPQDVLMNGKGVCCAPGQIVDANNSCQTPAPIPTPKSEVKAACEKGYELDTYGACIPCPVTPQAAAATVVAAIPSPAYIATPQAGIVIASSTCTLPPKADTVIATTACTLAATPLAAIATKGAYIQPTYSADKVSLNSNNVASNGFIGRSVVSVLALMSAAALIL